MITREEAAALFDAHMDGRPPWIADLARTVVALYDELERQRERADGVLESASALEQYAIAGCDTLAHDHLLAEAIAERDAARLDLRRLRAAEAPGTDDEALPGWMWRADLRGWSYGGGLSPSARRLAAWPDGRPSGWVADPNDDRNYSCALDAMRAAVPGSV